MQVSIYKKIFAILAICGLLVLPYALDNWVEVEQSKFFLISKQCTKPEIIRTFLTEQKQHDIVFLGTSDIISSIDHSEVSLRISSKLNKPVSTLMLACENGDSALNYSLLSALVKESKIKMLVLETNKIPNEPVRRDPFAYQWWRHFKNIELVNELPMKNRIELYAEAVFGGPLKLFIYLKDYKYFKPYNYQPMFNQISLQTLQQMKENNSGNINSEIEAPSDISKFKYSNLKKQREVQSYEFNPKQLVFLKEILKLTKANNIKLVLLNNQVVSNINDPIFVPENLPAEFDEIEFISIPEKEIIKSEDNAYWISLLDQWRVHRMEKAEKLYTEAVLPVLFRLYEEADEK